MNVFFSSMADLDAGKILEDFQVTAISMMEQFQSCGYNELLVHVDRLLSNWPQLGGGVANLGTQLLVGWSDKDTAIYLSWDGIVDDVKREDWTTIGFKFQNFISQTVKYLGPDTFTKVKPPTS